MKEDDPNDQNIDLVFDGVEFLHLSNMSQRLHLTNWKLDSFIATLEDIQFLEDASLPIRKPDSVFVVRGENGGKWYIGAGHLSIKMNQLYSLETTIDSL